MSSAGSDTAEEKKKKSKGEVPLSWKAWEGDTCQPPALLLTAQRAMRPLGSPKLGGQGGMKKKKVEAAVKRSKKMKRSLPVFPITIYIDGSPNGKLKIEVARICCCNFT